METKRIKICYDNESSLYGNMSIKFHNLINFAH
jgi:hypothetical protein